MRQCIFYSPIVWGGRIRHFGGLLAVSNVRCKNLTRFFGEYKTFFGGGNIPLQMPIINIAYASSRFLRMKIEFWSIDENVVNGCFSVLAHSILQHQRSGVLFLYSVRTSQTTDSFRQHLKTSNCFLTTLAPKLAHLIRSRLNDFCHGCP